VPRQREEEAPPSTGKGRGIGAWGGRQRRRAWGGRQRRRVLGREAATSGVGSVREREWGMRRLGFPHLYTVTCIRAKMGFS